MPIKRSVRPEIMDSVALLVIDAQESFIEALPDKETFLQRCAFAIEAARCFKLHTLFTEQAPDKLGRTHPSLLRLADNPRVFSKTSFSALNAPGIERYLREKEIYHLLVVGLETPICIYQTGLQATEEDVDITFFTDAISCRRKEDEGPVLDTLTRMGCQALPSESVFYSLLGDVSNPYFRSFNDLVKTFSASDFNLEAYLKNRPRFEEPKPQQQRKQQSGEPSRRDGGQSAQERNRESAPQGDEKRSSQHERGRRRRGGRGRNRQASEAKPNTANSQGSGRNDSRGRKSDSKPPQKSEAETTHSSAPAKPAASPKKATAKKTPAKKAAKRVAKKAAKKVAKKVAKKSASPKE